MECHIKYSRCQTNFLEDVNIINTGVVARKTLRMYPPLSFVTRTCVKDYKVPDEDLVIDKGTRVFIPIRGIHYDERHFIDPEVFDPERFNEANKKKIQQYSYLPFGEGPRICIVKMVRNYIRKTTKGADGSRYIKLDLQNAIREVRNNDMRLRRNTTIYQGPRTTLRYYNDGTRGKGIITKRGKGCGGKLSVPLEDENKLAECLIAMEKWEFGFSRNEVLDVVQNYVINNNLKTKFKDGRPNVSRNGIICQSRSLKELNTYLSTVTLVNNVNRKQKEFDDPNKGERFGIMQTKVGLSCILRNFKVTLNKKTQLPLKMDPTKIFPVAEGGIWLNLEKLPSKI
ncbi:hypothetical protein NQ318_005485 [Aromia moschata]|uniref:Cytochrome P450 n=1 Tax=Aromia moschata TaxID=1265417 RepID=A0AAV8XNT5_9CUCU|nr:hypothetical protein NQ318_005485 [Aromia moschata]